MRGKILENVLMFSRNYLSNLIKEGWVCIDATLGNGNDLLLLSDLVGKKGFVYGFDIQKEALKNTETLMKTKGKYSNYKLFCCGHETMDLKIRGSVNFIIFNLGYLPKGDKTLSTQKTTTLIAVQKSLDILAKHGLLWLVIYPGHPSGAEEAIALEAYLKHLDQKKFSVMKFGLINQINNPPFVVTIEKKY